MNWLLPEYLADALPIEAARIERQRRTVLDLFRVHGYELVMPPLIEYLDSLLTGSGQDLKLRTFKLVDQVSGRTLGVRADITPQVARIDAHLLNREGVTRLCYCDSVLHTMPASISASREPIQIGAELYGHAGHEADLEVVRLMSAALTAAGTTASRIDLGHVGIFRALAEAAGLTADQLDTALSLLQGKDVPGLEEFCAGLAEPYRSAFLRLPELYGGVEVLDLAAGVLPALGSVTAALADLKKLAAAMPELPLSFDLSDLRGYHYHNGVVFAAYHPGAAAAVALGGRYDGVGKDFGRARAATGFSMDLRVVAQIVGSDDAAGAILAPYAGQDLALAARIDALRQSGEVVVELLPGQSMPEGPHCDRRLVASGQQWVIEAIQKV
ncbi:MAG: phosphoribosyltransferase regulatory subunit [Pseudomonadota bacterium]|nr:phosphoribosyltransferase regulatory subunit [Pseudomonadota bacterium]MDQ5881978.1 phosphoribosyltransferase regulatory subunit [Pseudomonadota bacterium]MDQ5916619.1 phosphoribosyltransferase regulatory subunit [Pseudomonadota bacterium]MDQ5917772.1 phosphoribosyltransferase regulatory subunit [Pseudomonadota bacterium]